MWEQNILPFIFTLKKARWQRKFANLFLGLYCFAANNFFWELENIYIS